MKRKLGPFQPRRRKSATQRATDDPPPPLSAATPQQPVAATHVTLENTASALLPQQASILTPPARAIAVSHSPPPAAIGPANLASHPPATNPATNQSLLLPYPSTNASSVTQPPQKLTPDHPPIPVIDLTRLHPNQVASAPRPGLAQQQVASSNAFRSVPQQHTPTRSGATHGFTWQTPITPAGSAMPPNVHSPPARLSSAQNQNAGMNGHVGTPHALPFQPAPQPAVNETLSVSPPMAKDFRITALARTPAFHHLETLVFLQMNRPEVFDKFTQTCCQVYNNFYRRGKKPASHALQARPGQAVNGAQNLHGSQLDAVPPTAPPVSQSPTQEQIQAMLRDRLPQTQGEAKPQHPPAQSYPVPQPAVSTPAMNNNNSVNQLARMTLADEEHGDKGPIVPIVEARQFRARATIIGKIQERWDALMNDEGKPPALLSDDAKSYVIWKSVEKQVLLPVEFCDNLVGLLNNAKQLAAIQAEVLRFLWYYLMENRVSGAIFCHGIGFPRTHILATFFHLISEEVQGRRKQILVVCPASAVRQWRDAFNACQQSHARILSFESFAVDVLTWQEDRGILVCSSENYEEIIKLDFSTDRESALRGLCRPGPDILVLDEAPRVLAQDMLLLMHLNRTKTGSRLALTSLPFNGQLLRYWSILNWVAPEALGSQREYWKVFLRNIIAGSCEEATMQKRTTARWITQHLYRVVDHLTFRVNANTRIATLREKGSTLQEGNILCHLSQSHSAVYNRLAQLLTETVHREILSPYVAIHLLLIASTSLSALRTALSQKLKQEDGEFGIAADVCRPLSELLGKLPIADQECSTKIDILIRMGRHCLRTSERLVVFVSFPEVQEVVWSTLRDSLKVHEQSQLFNFDLATDPKHRAEQLSQFNIKKIGAILLVPYGPMLECMEDSGWGFINATQVVVLDANWHAASRSQVVERVLNFGCGGVPCIRIYNLLAGDTVDIVAHSEEVHQGSSPLLPRAIASIFLQRADLEKQASWMGLEEARRYASEQKLAIDENFIVPLEQLDDDALQIAIQQVPNLYASASESLAKTLRMDSRCEEKTAARAVALERISYFKSLKSGIREYEDVIYNSDFYTKWQATEVSKHRRLLDGGPDSLQPHHSLPSHWRGYFLTYEQEASKLAIRDERSADQKSESKSTSGREANIQGHRRTPVKRSTPDRNFEEPRGRPPVRRRWGN